MAIYILDLCVRIFLANYRGTDGWWADVNDFDRVESRDRVMVATQTFVIKFFLVVLSTPIWTQKDKILFK